MGPASVPGSGRDDSRSIDETSIVPTEKSDAESSGRDNEIPKYTIDLSLPPTERYAHIAREFKPFAAQLPTLFDELVQETLPTISVTKVRHLARLTLRRLYDREENEELQGISHIIGIEMWLLVALNVLLDLFMGCSSGGVRVDHDGRKSRMLHFRTLDWGMDPLRNIIVHLDFVKSPGGEVIGSSLGYFGYVGVLTGVRKGLSLSLNFRPNHNGNSRLENFRFYFHILLVLLGFRQSISSLLRQCLLSPYNVSSTSSLQAQTLESIEQTLPSTATTAAYLIFSNGDRTIVMEKDSRTAVIRSADDFITVTNHDVAEEDRPRSQTVARQDLRTLQIMGMEEIVEESIFRKKDIAQLWEDSLGNSKYPKRISSEGLINRQVLTAVQVGAWLEEYPITNEETHFATVMDPKAGKLVWVRRYTEPLEFEPES